MKLILVLTSNTQNPFRAGNVLSHVMCFYSTMLCEVDYTIISPLGVLEEIIVVSIGGSKAKAREFHHIASTIVNEGITEILELYL
jgi:hypothetical protein